MKPNDENGKLPVSGRPFRVLIISGSNRRQYNCPGVDSKSRMLMLRMADRLPQDWEIDYEDLGNVYGRARIQSCNACVSTSMALCVWPCLPASERVLGARMRGIAELRPGDSISTGTVSRAWMSAPAAQVYRLRLSDGRQVRLTGNHPVKVIREIPREKVGREWKYVWHLDWVEAAKLRRGDRVPFPLGEECGTFAADSGRNTFYYLLAGLVFGDGTFAGQGQVRLFFDRRRPALATAVAALSPEPVDFRDQVFSAKETGWPTSANQHMHYACWDTSVGRILIDDLGLQENIPVAARHLPSKVLNGSEKEAIAFLRGWFSTDGSVDRHGRCIRASLASSSVPALRDAQILLAKLGIRSSVYDMSHKTVVMGGKPYARSSTLQITKTEAVLRFAERIGFLDEEKAALLPIREDYRRGCTNRDYGRVLSIEPDRVEPVYDIAVDPSHEFVAELVPLHNCNCYEKGDDKEPDLMWDLDLYARLDLADAWAIIGPHNWYGPTSNLKLMFDRLVCINGGNPREDLIAHKDPERAMALERSPEWRELSMNHLEGRTAGFFCHGDDGGDEIGADGRPRQLRHPEYFDPAREPFDDPRNAYAPLAWHCRHSGIEVPDALWRYEECGKGAPYADNQAEDIAAHAEFMAAFDRWVDEFARFVGAKGKVSPGKYRAYGYEPPPHRWADIKLKWRELRIKAGVPRRGSSPAAQQREDLTRDRTWNPKEGKRK